MEENKKIRKGFKWFMLLSLSTLLTSCYFYKATGTYIKSNRKIQSFEFSTLLVDSLNKDGFPEKYKKDTTYQCGMAPYSYHHLKKIYFKKAAESYTWLCQSPCKKEEQAADLFKGKTLPVEFSKDRWYLIDTIQYYSGNSYNLIQWFYVFIYIDKQGEFHSYSWYTPAP